MQLPIAPKLVSIPSDYIVKIGPVHDGDTFKDIDTLVPIRLRGIDTPELVSDKVMGVIAKTDPKYSQLKMQKDAADMATNELRRLLSTAAGGKVRISQATYDKYNRVVAFVYITQENGQEVNLSVEMLRRGTARIRPEFLDEIPEHIGQQMQDAVIYARTHKKGLWKTFPQFPFLTENLGATSSVSLDVIDKMTKFKYIPGATRIGSIWLYVPPAQWSVSEKNSNVEFPTLRTAGNPRVKTPDMEQRIEMSLIFPNAWSMNYQLRPLIAQFMRSPVLPLKNEDIQRLVAPGIDINIRTPSGDLDSELAKNSEAVRKAKELVDQAQPNTNPILKPLNMMGGTTSSTKINLQNDYVMIILRNIVVSTVPASPESLQVTLTMATFNHMPHTDKIEYLMDMPDLDVQLNYLYQLSLLKDPDFSDLSETLSKKNTARYTTDIAKSEPFKQYYKTLLQETQITESETKVNWTPSTRPRLHPVKEKNLNAISLVMDMTYRSAQDQLEMEELDADLRAKIEDSILRNVINQQQSKTFVTFLSEIIDQTLFKVGDAVGFLLLNFIAQNKNNVIFSSIEDLDRNLTEETFKLAMIGLCSSYGVSKWREIVVNRSDRSAANDVFKSMYDGFCVAYNSVIREIGADLKIQFEKIIGRIKRRKLELTTNDKTVINGITASYSPVVVPIPVLGHTVPSMQIFGRTDWAININISTCDKVKLTEIMRFFQMARLTREAREETSLRWYTMKLNAMAVPYQSKSNGFFAFLGIGKTMIDTITCDTSQGKPGWYTMNIQLIQSDLDIAQHERLLASNRVSSAVIDQINNGILKTVGNKTIEQLKELGKGSTPIAELYRSIYLTIKQSLTLMNIDIARVTHRNVSEFIMANDPTKREEAKQDQYTTASEAWQKLMESLMDIPLSILG